MIFIRIVETIGITDGNGKVIPEVRGVRSN